MKNLFAIAAGILIGFIYTQVNAQTITGKVITERGLAASGVSVKFAGKENPIATEKDGSFKIIATHLPDTLVFSGPDFETYKVVVTEKTLSDSHFEVVLLSKREIRNLSEVVVMGYSTAKKKDLTSSISSISAKEITDVSVASADEMSTELRGAVSGISVESAPVSAGKVVGNASKKLFLNDSLIPENGKPLTTKLLTAGEINDFRKWKLWTDYTENEFKSYANSWGFYTKERFVVQIRNNSHYALPGRKVYLINKNTKDTVWKAVTDNTGKAELWAGTSAAVKNNNNNFFIACEGSGVIENALPFESGINTFTLNTSCNSSKLVQIAFVVDATGSMADEIEYLKLELEDVIGRTFTQYKNLDLEAGSVFYRDKGDEYLTRNIDFSSDVLKMLNFIKLQQANGGGDEPEAVNAALTVALDSLHWNADARARLMFLVLDAPPHNEAKEEIYTLVQKAAAKGIRVIPIVCSGGSKNTEFIMRTIALATNGTYLFLTDHSGVGGSHTKPTTDYFAVELLNNLLPEVIRQMIYTDDCTTPDKEISVKWQNNILQVTVYPNPTSGIITIKSNKNIRDIFVTDFTGKILRKLELNEKKYTTDISSFPSGTYIIRYITKDDEWGAAKILLVQ